MKKIKSVFRFEESLNPLRNVSVLLTVDYENMDFSIYTEHSTEFDSIKKEKGCAIPEWRALLRCIQKAINFGEKELIMEDDPDLTDVDFEDDELLD